MANIITIGFTGEGKTDERFLEHIIQRTFENVAFECDGDIEVFQPVYIESKGNFIEKVLFSAKKAEENGLMVLCVHTDADEQTDKTAFQYRIDPAFTLVHDSNETLCKNLVAVIPIQETESWMLADKELFKDEIGISKPDGETNLHREPEKIARPKEFIKDIINQTFEELPIRRRYQITISDLYTPIGQKADLEKLNKLPSYKKFEEGVRNAYKKLNYISE